MISWMCITLVCASLWAQLTNGADVSIPQVRAEKNRLIYEVSEQGDRVPDFSYCGYVGGNQSIPNIATRLTLSPSGGDDTERIQAALDRLAELAPDEVGWHGALQLSAGTFQVSGTIKLSNSHVVLRGNMDGDRKTKIVATGDARRPLIVIGAAAGEASEIGSAASDRGSVAGPAVPARIATRVPIGAFSVRIAEANQFEVGQRVQVVHPSTSQWIAAVGMNTFPSDDGRGSWLDWKPGTVDQVWTRTITAVEKEQVTFDAPLTSAIEPVLTPAFIVAEKRLPSASQVGVEYLELVSDVNTHVNPKDEEHAWDGIRLLDVTDAWVRSVSFTHFSGSAVQVGRSARRVTVSDCISSEPVSEDAGWRRQTFYGLGQQALFLRCRAQGGRHDFAVGPLTSGPNAFVYCSAQQATEFSGPMGNWASGVLYDNVEIDGANLELTNRETAAQGAGWSAANCILWNCVAPKIVCRKPPTGFNWAIGVWGEVAGDGVWRELNQFVSPDSLYETQLAERVGVERARQIMSPPVAISLPATVDAPEVSSRAEYSPRTDSRIDADRADDSSRKLHLKNGWLAIGDTLAIGSRMRLSWWRGSVLEGKVDEFGSNITRFVPGRDEPGYTDDIGQMAEKIQGNGSIALEHHWGLWYDRRRDDHQMIRRIDGDVWPPFFEQPWARSGHGQAWDGLSKYDLTRFNTWYFSRLAEFADHADARGLILMQYMYFQHNILEAGAHWADFPWRPANCLQETGFPEPPEYVNRKRVFMAEAFYDIEHASRRDLHTRYIRHCLDTLGNHSNVMFVLGEEFTGPTHFVKFWLETIAQWERDRNREVLTVLSVPRDVQEAILTDSKYASLVDVIDVKYWWYTSDGGCYDPPGAQSLAPRQQLREWKGEKKHSAASIMRSVGELRTRFPMKAVICSLDGVDDWSVLVAGGSLVDLPRSTDAELRRELLEYLPKVARESQYSLVSGELQRLTIGSVGSAGSLESETGASASQAKFFVQIDRDTGGVNSTQVHSNDSSERSRSPVFWRRKD